MVRVNINGRSIEVAPGTTVLNAARKAGIEIPTLCDHPSLKPYGGCRLCVVEVEGMRTLQASCTLPVSDGMVIHTDTPKTKSAREFVLTLLFSERNHFCMYCQKTAGDCELQNAAYGEGMTHWPLQPNWKPYYVDGSHPYFVLDNNRCILCRRCVRACDELVGNRTLTLENRGASTLLVADYGIPLGESTCVRCGTCVQVCPTGALIDRVSAYQGKDVEFEHVRSVCQGCSLGCGIEMLLRDNRLVRIDGDWDHPVNGGVLCEVGHYLPLEDDRPRLNTPLVRRNGSLEPVSWDEALAFAASGLSSRAANGDIAALASTRLNAEALYAFKELFADKLGCKMVAVNEALPGNVPSSTSDLEALKTSDCVVVLDADLTVDHQVAGFFIKRNLYQGTDLVVIDTEENGLDGFTTHSLRPAGGKEAELLKGLISAIMSLGLNQADLPAGFRLEEKSLNERAQAVGISSERLSEIARVIASAQKPVFVFDRTLAEREGGKALEALSVLAGMVNAASINLMGGANSRAAQLYGFGSTFQPQKHAAAFLALGDEPASMQLEESLEDIPFLAVMASHESPLTQRADVVLPTAIWAEEAGHYLNLEGRLQAANRGLEPAEGVRTNLEALTALAERLGFGLSGEWQAAIPEWVPAAA